jgi:O-antigen/teichoic acid export membrane protein
MEDLKERAVRGGVAKFGAQIATLALRVSYMVVMARLLDPRDFGLVTMVLVVTGVLDLFSTAGLSTVTVQRETISDRQISGLFWINLLVGTLLALLILAIAPALVALYQEERLFWIAAALSAGFFFTGAGVQHMALLQRQLRYVAVATIEISSQLIAYAIGIGMALADFGYWSLVAAAVAPPCLTTVFCWATTGWIPTKPQREAEIAAMLRFGGTISLNGVIVYFAYNFDKFLLGRFWGADALGVYGRAYQLVNIPTQALNGAVGAVMFSAMSRVQGDPVRLKSYFLKSYTLLISLTVPITIFSAILSEEIIAVVLGPKWGDAAAMFRLLTPTILVFGIINPLFWFLLAVGKQMRSLYIACAIAPLVITAYVVGLPYGPNGVALAFSIAMTLWVVPHVIWCLHRTPLSPLDLFLAAWKPFAAGLLAAALVAVLQGRVVKVDSAIIRLTLEGSAMGTIYLVVLLFGLGQKDLFLDLLRPLLPNRFLRRPESGGLTP